jgi:hypothetical protein
MRFDLMRLFREGFRLKLVERTCLILPYTFALEEWIVPKAPAAPPPSFEFSPTMSILRSWVLGWGWKMALRSNFKEELLIMIALDSWLLVVCGVSTPSPADIKLLSSWLK